MYRLRIITLVALLSLSCSSNENAHTTATTYVPPPPQQLLRIETRAAKQVPAQPEDPKSKFDPTKPLLVFNLPNGKTFREGEPVVIDFSLANAKLKGDGGDHLVRYIVDDEEMRYVSRWEELVITGWTPGKHTIRLELIGPDGWPYRNGDHNVVTRDLTVVK